eukprot:8842517-Ditylum_brightwellii.AAC.1
MDVSWVACILSRGKCEPKFIAITATSLNALARKIPSIVNPILGGEKLYQSTCNPTKCIAAREKKQADSIVSRCKATVLSNKINMGDGKEGDEDHLKELNDKSAKLERESSNHLPSGFITILDNK